MEFLRADAYFSTHAKLAAVCKCCRSIGIDCRCVNTVEKLLNDLRVFGDDGVENGVRYLIGDFVREKGFSLNDLSSVAWNENLYFIGYWQTEKYFRLVAESGHVTPQQAPILSTFSTDYQLKE